MNKAEGAGLARQAAESYSHQIEAIDRTVHQLDAAVAPLFESFRSEVSALAAELLPDAGRIADLKDAPLLQIWRDLIAPYTGALAEQLAQLRAQKQNLRNQPNFESIKRIANWVGQQRDMEKFEQQAHFQTLYRIHKGQQKMNGWLKLKLFFLGLIGRPPQRLIPAALGMENLDACFGRYGALEARFNAPEARPSEADQSNPALLALAQSYTEVMPRLERIEAFYSEAVRLETSRELFVAGLLSTLLDPEGHVGAAAQQNAKGLAAALLSNSPERIKKEAEALIKMQLEPETFDQALYNELLKDLLRAKRLKADTDAAVKLHQPQAAQRIHLQLLKALPAQAERLARFHALSQQLNYTNQVGAFLAQQRRDRRLRQNKMQQIAGLWQRRPGERLDDKQKWLVEVPKIKGESLNKQLALSRNLHQALVEFSDYTGYAALLNSKQAFVPFDALVLHARKSIPHEGFNRMVIAELGGQRQEQALDRADYRALENILHQERAQQSAAYDDGDGGVVIYDSFIEPYDAPFTDTYLPEIYDEQEEVYSDGSHPEDSSDGPGVLEALIEEGVSDGMLEADVS